MTDLTLIEERIDRIRHESLRYNRDGDCSCNICFLLAEVDRLADLVDNGAAWGDPGATVEANPYGRSADA